MLNWHETLDEKCMKMIDAGKSDEQILDFLVARYGDFVLYRPFQCEHAFAMDRPLRGPSWSAHRFDYLDPKTGPGREHRR